jgi:hypothetical protein
MIELGMIRDVVAILAGIVGLTYYIITVRNANKIRKTQLASRISEKYWSPEFRRNSLELFSMKWTDFNDFDRKYDSTVNPENCVIRYQNWGLFQELGYLLHEGLVDMETVYSLMGGYTLSVMLWVKFESIILEQRKKYKDPSWFMYFEYFGNEFKKYRVQSGLEAELIDPDGFLTNYPES